MGPSVHQKRWLLDFDFLFKGNTLGMLTYNYFEQPFAGTRISFTSSNEQKGPAACQYLPYFVIMATAMSCIGVFNVDVAL